MKIFGVVAAAGLGFALLAGCSSIIEGRKQVVSFDTVPSGADCTLVRGGLVFAQLKTPSQFTIEKDKREIVVFCNKPGFEPAKAVMGSGVDEATYWNGAVAVVSVLGVAGWAYDSATGADNRYQDSLTLALLAKPQ